MRRLSVSVVLASALALGAGLIVGAPASAVMSPVAEATTWSTPVARASTGGTPASPLSPRIDVKGLAMQAFGVAKKLYACEDLAKKGLACLKDPTIKDVLKRLDAIEAQIARNQEQTMRALDSLQRSIDGEALAKAVKDLSPVEAHIFEAAQAWSALSDCAARAVTPEATCKGYNGASTEPLPVAEGMALSREFFLGQMAKISLSIEQATQYFAGTQSIGGRDGLLHALWKSAKRQQDRDSGAKSPGELPLRPEVVTRSLAVNFLPTMTYYRDMVFLYGALRPAAKELKGLTTKAQSEANLADKNIFAATSRWTVTGAFDFYRIPDVPLGAIAYVGRDGRLYKIVKGEGRGVRLTAGVVQEIGDRIAAYGYDADTMRKDPALLPHGGRFGVIEKVKKRNHIEYLGKYAICASEASIRPCDDYLDGTASETFEIGHSGAIGSRDQYGNVMKERWVPMRILNKPAKWGSLVDQARAEPYGSCTLKGEPPYGVFGVQFLSTFRRLVEGKHADFEWMTVRYGYSNRLSVTPKCVGPGMYVSQTRGDPFSVVDQGTPAGILVK